MPSKSKKQAKLMRAVAHGWKPSRIKGPTRAVAKEFVSADKRRDEVTGYNHGGYNRGGEMGYDEYQFGGGVPSGMYGNTMNRFGGQYRGVPPQRGQIQRGPTGMMGRGMQRPGPRQGGGRGPGGGALQQYGQRGQSGPGRSPIRNWGGRAQPYRMSPGQMAANTPDAHQRTAADRARAAGMLSGGSRGPVTPRPDAGALSQAGKPGPGMIPLAGGRGYPGGGNPNLRGRNPLTRAARNRTGRRGMFS